MRFKDFGLSIIFCLAVGVGATALSLPSLFGGETTVLVFGIVFGPLVVLVGLAGIAFILMVRVSRVKYYHRLLDYRASRRST